MKKIKEVIALLEESYANAQTIGWGNASAILTQGIKLAITALRSMPVTYQVRQVDDADGDWYDVPFKTYEIFKLYPVSRRKIILLEE